MHLAHNHLHLWRIDLGQTDLVGSQDGGFWDCLSQDEVERANRFRFDRDRTRFVQSRGSLRHILSRYIGTAPQALTFTYSPHGKPSLAAFPHLSFNLSHSGDMALCAVTRHRRVGVDVEQHRHITHFDSLSRRCLTEAERRTLEPLPEAERQQLFLQYWTGKEAYLKAIGCGLTQSLTSVSVQLSPPRLVQVPEPGDWHLYPVVVEQGAAAVVIEGKTASIQYLFTLP